MTQFAVLHIEKNKGSKEGLSKHITRETIPGNADSSRTYLDKIIVGTKDQQEDINARIKAAVTQTTAIRKDAVKAMQIMLTGSHDRMKEIEIQGGLNAWVDKNQSWLNKTFGKENIVNLALHLDEETPHLHATVTPITADGRLCAKEFMSKINLKNYQTSYALEMQPFGLTRGVEGSRAKHQDTSQFYKKLPELLSEQETMIKDNSTILDAQRKQLEQIKKEKNEYGSISLLDALGKRGELATIKRQNEDLNIKVGELLSKVKMLESDIEKLKRLDKNKDNKVEELTRKLNTVEGNAINHTVSLINRFLFAKRIPEIDVRADKVSFKDSSQNRNLTR